MSETTHTTTHRHPPEELNLQQQCCGELAEQVVIFIKPKKADVLSVKKPEGKGPPGKMGVDGC
jgi:hypothetical protein